MDESVVDRVRTVMGEASQAAFGRRVGLSADKLSKSLKGTRRFTSLDLARIAEEGRTTVDWLLSGRAPLRPAFAARTSAPIAAQLDREALQGIVERFTVAYETLELLGRAAELPRLPQVAADAGSPVAQGEELAGQALAMLADAGVPQVAELETADLMHAVERVFGADVSKALLPSGVDGAAWQADGFRLVLVSTQAAWTRQRFTLAHELGHLLARDAQDLLTETHLAPGRQKDLDEVRANAFAAHLLMPYAEIRAALGDTDDQREPDDEEFRALVVRFKVSPSALAARLAALGIIAPERRDALRRLTAKACHLLAGQGDVHEGRTAWAQASRIPPRPAKSLYEAYVDGETTLRTLAAYCDVDVEELHSALDPGPADDVAPAAGAETGDLVFQP